MRTTTNSKNSVSLPISYADVPGSPTPLINLKVKTNNKTLLTLRSLPDTGASIDCVDAKFVKKHNIEIIPDTTKMIELISTEGIAMAVLGTCKLQIQNIGGHGFIETIALVCPNLSHNFLCSWITQKKLNLLHKGWHFVRLYNASAATLTEVPTTPRRLRPRTKAPDPKIPEWPKQEWPKELQDLCREFEDVLVEELDSEQVVRCPPMDVDHFLLEDLARIPYTGKKR